MKFSSGRVDRILRITIIISALLIMVASSLLAQEEADKSETSTQVLMEELQVTARKKGPEDLQRVPVAISAFTGEQLEARFTNDIQDITSSVPNAMAYEVSAFPAYVNFYMRGMGVAGTVLSDDPAVGVFVDGVYLGISAGVLMDTFDLESVEMLRGPQGTLFGRNVTGGAALLRTRKPSEDFSTRLRLIAGSDGRVEGAVSVSGPISEGFLGKIAAFYKTRDDWMDNPSGNVLGFDDLGEQEQKVIRAAFTWLISDSATADFRFEYGDSQDDPTPTWAIDNTALLGVQPIPGISEPGAENSDDPIANGVLLDPIDTKWTTASIEFNWQVGPGNLQSITAWRDIEQDGLAQDFDGSIVQIFDINNSYLAQDQFSQEFVYNLNIGQKISLTTGVYYFDQSYQYGERRFGTRFAPYGDTVDPVSGAPVGGLHTQSDTDHEVMGAFLQADIGLGEKWVLTLGGRYSREEKATAIGQFGAGIVDGTFNCTDLVSKDPHDCPPNFFGKEDWNNFTPKVGIQYLASSTAMFYGSWTRGFRSGGFNIRQNTGDLPGPYDEEKVDAFELGFKTELAEGVARLNGALFYNNYTDLQRTVINQEGFQAVSNAASATIQGIELELSWIPINNFVIQASIGYIDSEMNDFVNPGTDVVINGTRLSFVPDYQFDISGTYELVLNPGNITFRATYHKEGGTESTDDNQGYPGAGWNQVDASVSYAPNDGDWRVTAFGRNLSDDITSNLILNAINPGWVLGTGRLPRSYGIEFTYEWY